MPALLLQVLESSVAQSRTGGSCLVSAWPSRVSLQFRRRRLNYMNMYINTRKYTSTSTVLYPRTQTCAHPGAKVNRLYAIDAFSRHERVHPLTAFSRQNNGPRLDACNSRIEGRFPIPIESPFHAVSRGVFGIGLRYSQTKS